MDVFADYLQLSACIADLQGLLSARIVSMLFGPQALFLPDAKWNEAESEQISQQLAQRKRRLKEFVLERIKERLKKRQRNMPR